MAKTERTWTISELAREFKVTARALRFYEDKGLLSPKRDGMNRVYSARDRGRLQLILRGKRVGFPLAEIKEILDLYDINDGERQQMRLAARKFRARLAILQAQRDDIVSAIDTLKERIDWLDARLKEPASAESTAQARAFEAVAKRRLEDA
jgi:DNA-binding transcriptional MerR regulator